MPPHQRLCKDGVRGALTFQCKPSTAHLNPSSCQDSNRECDGCRTTGRIQSGSGGSGNSVLGGLSGGPGSGATAGNGGSNAGAGYAHLGGGGASVFIFLKGSSVAPSAQGGNGGGGYAGYGGKSTYSTGSGTFTGNGAGGGAGFIGMSWTTTVPTAGHSAGCTSTGNGGYGYGAGGGGGAGCTGSWKGGDGADGFVAFEW